MSYQAQWLAASREATTIMPFTHGMTREEVRLVSCPVCGAGSTDKCTYPNQGDSSVRRQKTRIHRRRMLKAIEYRAEHRI